MYEIIIFYVKILTSARVCEGRSILSSTNNNAYLSSITCIAQEKCIVFFLSLKIIETKKRIIYHSLHVSRRKSTYLHSFFSPLPDKIGSKIF